FLDKQGYSLVFLEQSPDRTFVAWMLLSKRKPNQRMLSILAPGEEPEYVKKQELYRERPYQVLRLEYRRDEPINIEDTRSEANFPVFVSTEGFTPELCAFLWLCLHARRIG